MLVIHVYIQGKNGNVERAYDFLRNDGKEDLSGFDCIIPYDKELNYPIAEYDAMKMIHITEKGDH